MLMRARSALLLVASTLFAVTPLIARTHVHYGEGFSVDLDEPYNRVLQVVKNVADDGIVRGSSEYRGSSDLYGASPQTSCDAFRKPPAAGTVIYKVRSGTIAPDHFEASNDEGMVAVRYVVQSLGPKSTRLTIDAVFKESNGHYLHASDGTVENAEYLAISDEIKNMEDKEQKARQDAAIAQQQETIASLQTRLDDESEKLKATVAREQQLQNQLGAMPHGKAGQVRTAGADLKSLPYNQSRTLQTFAQGEKVLILQQTRAWSLVQTAEGKQGWIYNLMLQVNP